MVPSPFCFFPCCNAGSNLIVTGRRKPRLVKLKEDIEKAFPGVSVHALQLDMQDAEAVTALPGTLPDKFQVIDILVNNAGKALGIAPVSPCLPLAIASV